MAQLGSLPSELLRNIFSCIAFSDRHRLAMRRTHGAMTERGPFFSLRDLCRDMDPFDEVRNEARCTLGSLCLVSSKTRTLAEPFLYSSWKPHQKAGNLTVLGSWTNRQDICLGRFLRTLISCIDLAPHVRYIELKRWRIHPS